MRKLFTVGHQTNGKGPVFYGWNKGGNYLAVCGANRCLTIHDRQGKTVDQKTLSHTGPCVALEWDYTGETLAVLQQGSNQVMLWHSASRKIEALETGLKDLTLIKWNRAGPHLAVGTGKGNLLLYNKKTLKMNKIMMKHTKKITCGAWSMNGKLALSGEDKVLSISNSDGDLIDSLQLKEVPSQVQFSRMKNDGKNGAASESTVSMNLGGKTLLLVDLNNPQGEPVELAFSKDYGNVVSYKWFGDGYILIGFSAGQVVVVSTHRKEIVQEVSNFTAHSEDVADVTYCGALLKGASIGNSEVQVFNMNELSQIKIREDNKVELENEYKALQKVEWTDDGQILTVSSTNGNIHTFLTKIPVMHDAYGTRVLRLTSLRELVVRDALRGQDIAHLSVEIEPTFVSLGPDTCAVGMNNCVWYYALSASNDGDGVGRSTSRRQKPTSTASIVSQRSYVNTVQYVKLSAEYAAVMSEGMVTLHLINQQEATTEGYGGGHDERRQQRVFPERESESSRITSVAMTSRFMIFGTTTGCITYFSLEDWAILSEYRTSTGIRSVFPNANGTRLAFIDEANEGWIYSPVDDSMCPIENLQMDTDKILWDAQEWGLFVGCGSKKFTTYAYAPSTRWGAKCGPICKQTLRSQSNTVPLTTDKPHGFSPILAIQDRVVCQPSTQHQLHVVSLAARTHTTDTPTMLTSEQLQQGFFNRLGMNRLDLAWKFAKHMNKPEAWYALGDRALYLLDIEMAIRVYRTVQQPAMVLALDHLRHVNEKAMLLGHVALLFKNFNEAQNHFTKCSNPMLALEMRRDLMHWDAALALSRRLKPAVVPQISREYASQLEFRGELQAALKMYENGHVDIGAEGDVSHNRRKELENHNAQCQAGVARVMIRMGDLARGFSIAIQTETPAMAIECAQLFEELKQWTEAAQLYEKAELYDQAAQLYICKSKNLKAAANLMPLITSNKIQGLYGAAKEKEKDYPAAKKAYALAEDWDNVVRLLVSHLNDISSAYDVVRRTKSAEAAALVAKHCKKDGNPETAIEFLLLAKKTDEAFELASSNEKLHVFASILGDSGSNEDYTNLAKHYEKKKNFDLAGDYYKRCTRYDQALHRYLDAVAVLEAAQEGVQTPEALAEQEKAIDAVINKAIAVVGEAQSDKLNKTLIGFLTADGDNDTPKDPKYLFSLYMALGKYEKGCGLAIVIARREQTQGHYRVAHRLLFQTYKQLEKHDITISSDLRWNLQLLHSYLVVKPLMKALNDHDNAARMLIRVSKNIPKFPLHTVQILTSCVTECNKAAFDRSAYHYAKELVTSNDRKDIPEKHRKKIETIVRKPGYYSKAQEGKKKLTEADLTDPPEKVGPCPSCSAPLPMTMLDCPRCKSNVPYCIATGQHMLLDDWCVCPSCKFPALYSAFSQLVRQDEPCPMCEERVSLGDVRRITNPDPSIWQRAAMSIEPAGETGEATAPAASS
eukprot:TRINITY_DN3196_c0_g2_i1.p1 TRINITY_DN3196_c0_g2~~TRINITY_DN3196_c0_g2_i1.p1  ORF type:complete len:1456 (+),score=570.56 TRINITY_DN3196_c0_g2_i1:76-4443(+)